MRISDWSSDVCSSDLVSEVPALTVELHLAGRVVQHHRLRTGPALLLTRAAGQHSEAGARQRQAPTRGAAEGAKDPEQQGRGCHEGSLVSKGRLAPLWAVISWPCCLTPAAAGPSPYTRPPQHPRQRQM